MPVIEIGDRDILRSTIVEPGNWYRVRVETVGEAPSKNEAKPSTNFPLEGTILFNGDTGDTRFRGVPINVNFNSLAPGFAVGFLQALGVNVEKGKYDLKSAEGREIDMFIETGSYNNRLKNECNHKYRAPKPEVTAVEPS